MQPYEFGYCVGAATEKRALGPSLGGFNPLNQDNQLARTVGYFVPGLSSVQAGQDLMHNVSQGNVLGSLGSAGMMALGLIPGAGLLGGAAKGLMRGGIAARVCRRRAPLAHRRRAACWRRTAARPN
jgi:hypothetical protein